MKLSRMKRIEQLIYNTVVVHVNLTAHKPQCDTCNLNVVELYLGVVLKKVGRKTDGIKFVF